jgi:hypothetical protein
MPVTGDNLQVSLLAAAAGQTTYSFGAAAGTTVAGSNINVSDFVITGVNASANQPSADAASYSYGATLTYTSQFVGAGSRFLSRIGSVRANFTWVNPANVTLITDNGYQRVYSNVYNPGGTSCSASVAVAPTVRFADNFNTLATNHGVVRTGATVTLYSPPKPSVTGSSPNAPYNPCQNNGCGTIKCYGASIQLVGNAGTYQGVAGTSISYYIGGALQTTIAGNTSTYTSGRVYCGASSYSCYVVNNYNCVSNSINVTTLNYV